MIYRHKSSVQVLSDFATAAVGQGIAHETSAGGAVCVSRLMLAVSNSINKLVINAVPFLLNILLIYLICCIVSNIPRILLFPIYQQRFVSNSKLDVGKRTFSLATPNKSESSPYHFSVICHYNHLSKNSRGVIRSSLFEIAFLP